MKPPPPKSAMCRASRSTLADADGGGDANRRQHRGPAACPTHHLAPPPSLWRTQGLTKRRTISARLAATGARAWRATLRIKPRAMHARAPLALLTLVATLTLTAACGGRGQEASLSADACAEVWATTYRVAADALEPPPEEMSDTEQVGYELGQALVIRLGLALLADADQLSDDALRAEGISPEALLEELGVDEASAQRAEHCRDRYVCGITDEVEEPDQPSRWTCETRRVR